MLRMRTDKSADQANTVGDALALLDVHEGTGQISA
jgi:hypothetical protein